MSSEVILTHLHFVDDILLFGFGYFKEWTIFYEIKGL